MTSLVTITATKFGPKVVFMCCCMTLMISILCTILAVVTHVRLKNTNAPNIIIMISHLF